VRRDAHAPQAERESAQAYPSHARCAPGARQHLMSFTSRSAQPLSRNEHPIPSCGRGVRRTLNGLYLATTDSTSITRRGSSTSRPTATAASCTRILDGSSHACQWQVYVHPARRRPTQQTNNTLLLSEKARSTRSRRLEIFGRRRGSARMRHRLADRDVAVLHEEPRITRARRASPHLCLPATCWSVEAAEVREDWKPHAASLRGRVAEVPMSPSESLSVDHPRP